MERNAFTRTEALIVIAIVAVLAALAVPLLNRARTNLASGNGSCRSNLKQIGLGLIQYAQDYNETYPIMTTEQGWVGALQPYVKSTQLFGCPQEKQRGTDNVTDYWFNRRLAGAASGSLADAKWTLMAGDGEASDDPNVSLALLPPLWVTREDSPARRHREAGEYLFADGHVKSLKPAQITSGPPKAGRPTFLVKP